MTEQHPITPPPELVTQWFLGAKAMPVDQWVTDVATQAARWGADQELEACCEWVESNIGRSISREWGAELRAARRPKPPSLKAQALLALETADGADYPVATTVLTADQHALIRKALESLDD